MSKGSRLVHGAPLHLICRVKQLPGFDSLRPHISSLKCIFLSYVLLWSTVVAVFKGRLNYLPL
jgi:hypothetical protein